MQFLDQIFNSSTLSPHGFCLLWRPILLWTTVVSDGLIGIAYYSIPLALAYFVTRRSKIDFGWIFWLFATFILACGTTHFLSIWTMWHPDYGIEALVKAITALVSIFTAILLWPLIPKLLALPTPGELRDVNIALSRQIEERERVLTVLQQSEERFRDLYNHTPAPLSSQDERGCIIDVSDYLVRLLGFERSEMIGKPGSAFMPGESAMRMQTVLWPQLLEKGELRDIDLQILTKSGEILDTLFSARVERDPDGKFARTYSVLVDVTARKHAEAALGLEIEERNRIKEMLHQSQKMEAVGQLTGGIAHDFNNLLTAINGNLDLLAVRTKGNDQVSRLIDSAEKAVKRGANLTKQLLSFSRRQVLRPETFILKSRFDALATLLAGSLRSDIEFQIKLPDDLWPVMVDPSEFDLAIINICVNARDAMSKGGVLRVIAENIALGGQTEALPIQGEFVCLSVIDSGNGIPEDVLLRVFEPFFTTKELGKGTGLGLSQVYGFARQSGGLATIESQTDVGTTVSLYLPRAQNGDISQAPIQSHKPEFRLSGNILIVEDDDDVAFAAEGLIEDIGFTVTRAHGPQEALAMLGAEGTHFDIIFSDIVMPGTMSGIDFARQVQVLYPTIPIILTTGHSQAAAASGSEFFILPKPYNRDQLLAVFVSSR